MKDPWTLVKRASGSLTLTLPTLGAQEAWAFVILVAILVLAVIWLARNSEINEVETPILTWRRQTHRPRSKPP